MEKDTGGTHSLKQITVISGKGGTGKTTLTAAFAALAEDPVLADCDVDAADLHLLLKPKIKKTRGFHGLPLAKIDELKCKHCLRCMTYCRFNAINDVPEIIEEHCEGCGVCEFVCPEQAISLGKRESGLAYISDTRFGPLCHATLYTGEEASGKLVTMVRENATALAEEQHKSLVLIDGPPGIGCPVISAITGVDLVVIVTEPTLSGIHDLKRVYQVTNHFSIPAVVCINKTSINQENTNRIETFCQQQQIPVIGHLPYDVVVTEAMINEQTIVEYGKGTFPDRVKTMWDSICSYLEK